MIIIERHYNIDNPNGEGRMHCVNRKAFLDDDVEGVQKFLDMRSPVPGYEWYDIRFEYIK